MRGVMAAVQSTGRGWTRTAFIHASIVALVAPLAGCASGYMSGPPGGREDKIPPHVIATTPDTNATKTRPRALVVHFDKVISERPSTPGGTLESAVVISPRDGSPDVDWHRNSITVRPPHGWRANTTYTVTILPGITDLRGNLMKTGTTITFSTGDSISHASITGTTFDWLTGTPLTNAAVEAVASTDTTLVYVGVTDSIGHFALPGLSAGTYLVRAYTDQNGNHALDAKEAFDSTTVAVRTTEWVEMLAFVHDSSGPMLNNVTVQDSTTLRVSFGTPLNPVKPLTIENFTLKGSDSTKIAITAVTPLRQDSVAPATPQPQRGLIPSATGAPLPTVKRAPIPRPSRPLLYRDVLLTVATPLRQKVGYSLHADRVTSPTGVAATSNRTFVVPEAKPVQDSTTTHATTKPSSPPATPSAPHP